MFKDERTGNFYTQSLFLELSYVNPEYAIYTLKDDDYEHNGTVYKSIKRLYLSIGDPTEYEFATKCFGGWSHWQRICNKTKLLHPYIDEWRDELTVKLRSAGVRGVIDEASSDSKGALQAAKWLADKGWADKRKAGRPTNIEVAGERKAQAQVKDAVDKDLERITNTH